LNQSVSKTSWTILSVDVWSRITFQIQESQKRILDLCFCCQIAVAQIILLFLNNQSTVINFRTSRKLFFSFGFSFEKPDWRGYISILNMQINSFDEKVVSKFSFSTTCLTRVSDKFYAGNEGRLFFPQ
jgi:hypothetical protein